MYQFLLTTAECYISVNDIGWLLMNIYLKAELQPNVSIASSMCGFRNRFDYRYQNYFSF